MKRKIAILQNELGLQIDGNIRDLNDLTWHVLIELEMFTFEELNLVIKLNGDNIETLNDVLFIRYGYRDIEQLWFRRWFKMKDIDKEMQTTQELFDYGMISKKDYIEDMNYLEGLKFKKLLSDIKLWVQWLQYSHR